MREQITLDPAVAAELAGSEDAVLKALEGHLACDVFLRGNVLTLDGERADVEVGREVVRELSELIARGHEIAPGHDRGGHVGARPAREPVDDPRRRRLDAPRDRVAPKTVNQKRYVDSIRNNTITFGIGPAGTGKTYLAMAMATAALSRREVNRIILTRPAVEAGERLGFLPGTMMEKVDPYLRPLFDALYDMLEADRVNTHLERGVIEVAPLAFMRGRTLNDSFIILDEAQNTTPEQMKMFLTRLGFNSTMVVTGRHHADRPALRPALRPRRRARHPARRDRHRLHQLHRRGRRAPQARAADRRRLLASTRRARRPTCARRAAPPAAS